MDFLTRFPWEKVWENSFFIFFSTHMSCDYIKKKDIFLSDVYELLELSAFPKEIKFIEQGDEHATMYKESEITVNSIHQLKFVLKNCFWCAKVDLLYWCEKHNTVAFFWDCSDMSGYYSDGMESMDTMKLVFAQ